MPFSQVQGVLHDVELERAHQIVKWQGVYDDNAYTPEQWLNMMGTYADKVRYEVGITNQRKRFVQLAALAVAAVEALDRKVDE